MTEKIEDLDLYNILGIDITASASEVRRAYKKEALKCHPDKNPDNPKAAELFQRLTKVLEVLLDPSARSAYDKLLKAKEAARLRHSALDGQRKRFKEQLEEREKASTKVLSEEDKLRKEVERLRKEGAKLLQDEINSLKEEVLKSSEPFVAERDSSSCQILATWAEQSGGEKIYNQEALQRIFSKYGSVMTVAVAGNKAIIEFDDAKAAELAIKIEVGFLEDPLKVKPFKKTKKSKTKLPKNDFVSESLSARSSRHAAERKRLIEEMMKEDG